MTLAPLWSPSAIVNIAQANIIEVKGSCSDNSVTHIDTDTILDSGHRTPIYHEEPESYFTHRPQPVGPYPSHPVPFPGQHSPLPKEQPFLRAPRISGRNRTAGGNPKPGEEPIRREAPFSGSREVKIGVINQIVHNHSCPYTVSRSSTTPLDRLLKHVVEGAAHDPSDRAGAPKCHEKTREAVQGEVHTWADSEKVEDDPEAILWLSGPAGTGKAAIAGTVAATCRAKGTLAATFFFSATSSDPARQSQRGMITTLAYQLIQHEQIIGFKDEVLAAIDNDPTILDKSLIIQLEHLILGPLRRIEGRSDVSTWPRAIIVARVDECGPEGADLNNMDPTCLSTESPGHTALQDEAYRNIISTLIEAAEDCSFPFRILIASRPELAIHQLLSSTSPRMLKQISLDEKYPADADIALYLRSELTRIGKSLKFPSDWAGERIIAGLAQNSSGRFVYASLAIRFIGTSITNVQSRLDSVLEWRGNQRRGRHLAPIDALYLGILCSSPDPLLAVTWIHAILELQSDKDSHLITVKALLESEPGEAEHLLGNLSSLVYENNNGTAYQFFHKSLLDFLASKERCGDLHVGPNQVERFLQGRWLAVLRNRGPQIPLDIEDRKVFLRQYVDSFSMRYFYLPGGDNYTRSDVTWWTDICFTLLTPKEHRKQIENAHEIVHKLCWFRCQHDCKTWRLNLRKRPTFRQMLGSSQTPVKS